MKKKLILLLLTLVILNIYPAMAAHRTFPRGSSKSLSIGGVHSAIVVDSMAGLVYVADYLNSKVIVLSGLTPTPSILSSGITSTQDSNGEIIGISNPLALVIDPVIVGRVYVANSNIVNPYSIISGITSMSASNTMVENATFNNLDDRETAREKIICPSIAIDAATSRTYISDLITNQVHIFKNNLPPGMNYLGTFEGVNGARGITLDGTKIYIASSDTLTEINPGSSEPNRVTKLFGFNPSGIVIHPTTKKVYFSGISSIGDNSNTLIANPLDTMDGPTHKVKATIQTTLKNTTGNIALNPITNRLYVIDPVDETLTVISTATVAMTNIVENQIGAIYDVEKALSVAVDTTLNKVYVGTAGGILYVLNGSSI